MRELEQVDSLLVHSSNHLDVLEGPAIPNVDGWLDGRKFSSGDQITIQVTDCHRDDLLSVLGVETLLVKVVVQEDYDIANEVDYFLVKFFELLLIPIPRPRALGILPSNSIHHTPLRILAPNTINPL